MRELAELLGLLAGLDRHLESLNLRELQLLQKHRRDLDEQGHDDREGMRQLRAKRHARCHLNLDILGIHLLLLGRSHLHH